MAVSGTPLPKVLPSGTVKPMKPRGCQGCPLEFSGKGFMRAEGKGVLGVAVVAEALGANEAKDGLPLRPYAQSGAMFQRVAKRAGFDRSQFAIANIVWCQPPGNELVGAGYEAEAISHCRPNLENFFRVYQPKVVLALGNTPTSQLTGLSGEKLGVTSIRGYAIPSHKYPFVVVPTYHPSFLARGQYNLIGAMRRDVKFAVEVAKLGLPKIEADYRYVPKREELEEFYRLLLLHPEWYIQHDVETVDSLTKDDETEVEEKIQALTQVQFMADQGPAWVLPWEDWYQDFYRKIMALPNPKVSWNGWKFDNKRYQENDIRLNGIDHDLMWAWKHWQPDLPRGLQYATSFFVPGAQPWKHLHADQPGYYGWCDVHHLMRDREAIFKALELNGLMTSYQRHTVDFTSVVLNPMGERGLPINKPKREIWGQMVEEEKGKELAAMQPLVPEHLRNISPKDGYVRDPEDTTGMVRRKFLAEVPQTSSCPSCSGSGEIVTVTVSAKPKKGAERKITSVECGCKKEKGEADPECLSCGGDGWDEVVEWWQEKKKKCPECKGKGVKKTGETKVEEVERWAKLLPFKPSSDQLLRYIRWKHPKLVPKKLDDDEKETTAKDEIKRLAEKTKDPLYRHVVEYREWEKLLGAYYEGWAPTSDHPEDPEIGLVHAEFNVGPATAQLAAQRPNIFTLPKRGEKAEAFRGLIFAPQNPERTVLVEGDWTAAHALTLGFEAEDPLYMNVARNDIHGFVTMFSQHKPEKDRCVELALKGTPESLAEMKAIIKHYRKSDPVFEAVRNFKSKPAILGIGFKMGTRKLYMMNRESYANQKEADQFKAILVGLFPKVLSEKTDGKNQPIGYQLRIMQEGYNKGYLKSKGGYIRWFWDIYHWDPKNSCMAQGEDAEKCVAFNPANDAFAAMREVCLRLQNYQGRNLLEEFRLVNIVHDALVFNPKWKDADECLALVKQELERPVPFLVNPTTPGGLAIGSEFKISVDLAEQFEEKTWKTDVEKYLANLAVTLTPSVSPLTS